MKNIRTNLVLASAVLLISACASQPKSTSLLDQVRIDYVQAQGNPKIATYAALEMQSATEALAKANAAAKERESLETVDKLAYLAKQKIALATEVASKKSSESEIASSAAIRDQVRLDQRTQQVEQARLKAEEAERSAQAARDAAAAATQQKNLAQDNEAQAQRLAAEASARNTQLEAQLAELAAKKTERGLVITLGDVLFGTDLARLNADGTRVAQRLATILQQNPKRAVLVEGFADSTGQTRHNQELSERRAAAVRDALLDMGVARERISQRGYGESYPVAANDTAANRQLNRRVEIVLSDDRGVITPR
ncbi:MAG: OmpA family protein [Rhodoferax sp.]|nr:OmpA family protein [Rhodoferax sp.]